ncbi:MAG: WYL domain-containing protein [Cellvibrio sp. 79]|nr:MAG: WYL domain-containing protein [Cellvibrio sp. 79]
MEKTTVQQQRFQLIELLAYWEGRINTKDLEQYFQQSRQQSSQDINAYKQQAPENLNYDASLKAYLPTEFFNLRFVSENVDDYLHWLHFGNLKKHTPSISETLYIPSRKVSPVIMRGLVTAIRQQKRIDVDYISLNNPNAESRIIAPHTFINTGLRWHLRAWCEKSKAFRDFVLSRFRGTPELETKTENTQEKDTAWNTQVTVILEPDPRLSPQKQAVLVNDYQMQNGQLKITTRGCLVQYLLRELQVSTKVWDGTPEAQQLVCVNLSDIKPWLFEG